MMYLNNLDAVLQEIFTRWDLPGLAVGIVENNEIVYSRGFGVQNVETRSPVTMDSVFSTCSISKCLVASAVIQLAEAKKIDLDAPIVHYLPYFKMDDDRYRQITLRQMLSHTSGIPDMDDEEFAELLAQTDSDDDCAKRYVIDRLSNKKLLADPGQRFNYSDFNFTVLANMIPRVSGMTFEAYMQEHILLPAGMPHSTFLLKDIPPAVEVMPHYRTPELTPLPTHPWHRAAAPASFLHSTIPDMCHWAMTSLKQGGDILSQAGYRLMWTPVTDYGYTRPAIYEDYGLGWTLGHFAGVKTASHGGGGCGWVAFLLLMPEKNRGAVFCCNEFSMGARYQIIQAIANTLTDQMPQAGKVSWMVPINQALVQGNIEAAYTRYYEIKASQMDEYDLDEDDLPILANQYVQAKKPDLAIELLGLNIHAFPEYVDSYIQQARIFMQKGKRAEAEKSLLRALSYEPDNSDACLMLASLRG
jgi:CubicO group peptidase (beta-lactamase class C family)